jgi:cysteine desulfurase
VGWRHDVILTSGATEAIAIVASRARAEGRIVGATEHDAVSAAFGSSARMLPVDARGVIDLEALDELLANERALVAIQQVNNETGTIQPLADIAQRVSSAGSLLLADCAQAAGKLPLPDADFIVVASHKVGGPPGLGALLVKDMAMLTPSGGQEKGYRRGTENLPAAAGLAAALRSKAFAKAMPRLRTLRTKLEDAIVEAGGIVIGAGAERSAAIGAYAMPGVASASQLIQLDLAGIAVSAGSACSSGSMKPSRVLEAMGVATEIASSAIRVSFGPDTNDADVDRFLAEWRRIHDHAASRAA